MVYIEKKKGKKMHHENFLLLNAPFMLLVVVTQKYNDIAQYEGNYKADFLWSQIIFSISFLIDSYYEFM